MNRTFRIGAFALALIWGVWSAGAQTTPATAEITLTPQQRADIYRTVTQDRVKLRNAAPVEAKPAIGEQLPGNVELHMLPDPILSQVPETKQYRYTMWHDDVVIVDPINLKVVEVFRQ